ncbi:hypothetical protein [Streptomyces sp. NPDC012888]|uniref:hypothetical protein n=1 Tax=Streptomyces sp. NPDC012888 TaxID=3364855 RepID=UPI0036CB37C0
MIARAARTLAAVLGLGTLLLPAALAPAVHPWTAAALAGALALWCLLVAAAGGTESGGTEYGGPPEFVRARFGPGAARGVRGLYFAGFATGQAAVALAAGQFLAAALAAAGLPGLPGLLGGDSGWDAVPAVGSPGAAVGSPVAAGWTVAAGAAVLVLAAARATVRPAPAAGVPSAARRLRPAAALGLAGAWWLLGGAPLAAPADWAQPLLAVPLLFGWVGLESAVPGRRTALGGTLLGLGLAAALYGLLLRPAGNPAAAPAAAVAVLGLASAALCSVYCVSNLRAAGGYWAACTGLPGGTGVPAAAVLALGALVALPSHHGVAALLLGPGTATAAIFLFTVSAALRRPRTEESRHDHRPDRPLEGAARPAG